MNARQLVIGILLLITLFAISMLVVIVVNPRTATTSFNKVLDREFVNNTVSNLEYFKDPRTGICFAYFSGGSIATVPCENIPPNLLMEANLPK